MTDRLAEKAISLSNLSPEQATILSDALELYTRVHLGQLEYVIEELKLRNARGQGGACLSIKDLHSAETTMLDVKQRLFGFGAGASHGIGSENVPASAKAAYEMRKIIRHYLAWERNPGGGVGVDYDDPNLLTYTDEPRIAVSVHSEQDKTPRERTAPKA